MIYRVHSLLILVSHTEGHWNWNIREKSLHWNSKIRQHLVQSHFIYFHIYTALSTWLCRSFKHSKL